MKVINKDGLTLGFDLQKAVVIPYALINIVNKYRTHLLKDNKLDRITESHRDRPTAERNPLRQNQPKQTKPNPSQVPTNHVRVHAAHDREHGCYNNFTLYRGCTHSP
jgi:hypothetical protein